MSRSRRRPAGASLHGRKSGEEIEPGAGRQVVVERDDIDAARGDVRQRLVAVRRVRHLEAAAAERLLDEPHQRDVVVDIEDADDGLEPSDQAVSGTWMTEKNSPSWRMALAKPS